MYYSNTSNETTTLQIIRHATVQTCQMSHNDLQIVTPSSDQVHLVSNDDNPLIDGREEP